MSVLRENKFILNLTKKKHERSESFIGLKDDGISIDKINNFNELTVLFSQLENNLKLFKELPELQLIEKYAL